MKNYSTVPAGGRGSTAASRFANALTTRTSLPPQKIASAPSGKKCPPANIDEDDEDDDELSAGPSNGVKDTCKLEVNVAHFNSMLMARGVNYKMRRKKE